MNTVKLSRLIPVTSLVATGLFFTQSFAQDRNIATDQELLDNPDSFVENIVRGSSEPHLISNQTLTKLFLAHIESLSNSDKPSGGRVNLGSYSNATSPQLAGLKYDLGLNEQDANTLVSIAQDTTLLLNKQRRSAINEICSDKFLAANIGTSISGMVAHSKVMQSEIDLEVDRYFNAEVKNEFGADGLDTIRDWLSSTFVPGVVQADFNAEAIYETAGIDKDEYLRLFCS